MAGGFAEGHIPVSGINDMIRITKPGGLVIISMRKSFLRCEEYKDRLIPYMDEMERQGKWIKLLARRHKIGGVSNASMHNLLLEVFIPTTSTAYDRELSMAMQMGISSGSRVLTGGISTSSSISTY
ncbi:uncharacterized protein LOC135216866 [Macrobrachium nipponense]|uniref:uncharacterized protein LOC135216866 n=1 Tax=Macrobrachium nipponense TaxID=159736 RepID=UPI0030C7D6E1